MANLIDVELCIDALRARETWLVREREENVNNLKKTRVKLNKACAERKKLKSTAEFPERHGTAWEDNEWDGLKQSLEALIENRMRVHKRTRVAIKCAIRTLLNKG